MSLNRKRELIAVAKVVCRDLRKNATKAERLFWDAVRNRKLEGKKFYRQYPFLHDITGRETFFVVDFYCHEEKLVIELDGSIHQYKLKEDKEREKILGYLGLRILRFRNEEVINNLDDVLKKVKSKFTLSNQHSTVSKRNSL